MQTDTAAAPKGSGDINLERIGPKIGFRRGEFAYDVRRIGKALTRMHFALDGYDDSGVDYYDSTSGRGIQSIGRRKSDGAIVAIGISHFPDLSFQTFPYSIVEFQ